MIFGLARRVAPRLALALPRAALLPRALSTAAGAPPAIDTQKYSELLQSEGFTPVQSAVILQLIEEAIEDNMETLKRQVVSNREKDALVSTYTAEVANLRSEVTQLSNKDFATLRSELDKISQTVAVLKETIPADVKKAHAGARLDINLDRGRIKDESLFLDECLKKSNEKISIESEALRKRLDKINRDLMQGIAKFMGGATAIFFSYKVFLFWESKSGTRE